jgi:hypothetical protein
MHRFGQRFLAVTGTVLVAGLLVAGLPAGASTPTAKAAPSKNLTNGKVVKVSGKGWPANDSLVIVECNSNAATNDQKACNENDIIDATANKKGVVPATDFTFATGTIGDGNCNPGATCYMALTEPSATGLHVLVKVTVKK